MLHDIGVATVDELFNVVPEAVRFPTLNLPPALSESEVLRQLNRMAARNADTAKTLSFLGAGAYNHFIPAAVDALLRRSEFYTAYTPYQPEIAQGTLQAIFEYQTLICALTGMDAANASHYDGATAVAEAAIMALSSVRNKRTILVAPTVHPHARQTLCTYTQGLGVTIKGDESHELNLDAFLAQIDDSTAAVIVQTPDFLGTLHDLKPIADKIHAVGGLLIASVDLVALGLFQNPGAAGADIVVGEGQGLGIPLSYGGPYLGVFACKEAYLRRMPGRLVGATTDMDGKLGYVLTLQTREQHIRREKATSNICTNQGLMALAATIHMSLLGKQGLRKVAELCYHHAQYAAAEIAKLPDFEVISNGPFFKEFVVRSQHPVRQINTLLAGQGIQGGYDLSADYPQLGNAMLVCVTEMHSKEDIDQFVQTLCTLWGEDEIS